MTLDVVILAAGQGKRMKSALPKVLHPIGGEPMLRRVVNAARELDPRAVRIVVGVGAEQVRQCFAADGVDFVEQREQKGTAHAVGCTLPQLASERVVVLFGDVPLIEAESLKRLVEDTAADQLGVITAVVAEPFGLGRILRQNGRIVAIREERDASEAERQVNEINSGLMVIPTAWLRETLPKIKPQNAQGEFYLTDLVEIAVREGRAVVSSRARADEVGGINDRAQLAAAERIWQLRQVRALMLAGVTVADPARLDVRGRVEAGQDSFIDTNVVLEGVVTLGQRVSIGPNCTLRDAIVGDDVVIKPNTVIDGAEIGQGCMIGPFARLRPGTVLAADVHIGNFVETKKAKLGIGTKANHLAYLGDTNIGDDCNIGAGTITCNYDGVAKHVTDIGDGVFVGSNATLVAPITLEAGAYVGAGSTITTKVPAKTLAVGRGRQRNIEGWKPPAGRRIAED